jgi:hypothetical protein
MGFGVQNLHKKRKASMSIIIKLRPTALSSMLTLGTPTSAMSQSAATPLETSLSTSSHPRSRRRDEIIRDLAPIFAEIRKAGHHGNAEIAKRLNEKGLRAPSGGPFSPETTRRIQMEIKRRGLGEGSRTVSAALSARADKDRERRLRKFAEDVARRTREHSKSD